jgi:hypothetical protein
VLATFGIALLASSGCVTGGPQSGGNRGASTGAASGNSTGAAATTPMNGGNLGIYLETMVELISGDALTRAAAFNDAERDAEFAPTTTNRLRYALALSIPGHSGSDAAAAALRLGALLATGDALLPEERMLASIQLRQAEQLQILASANAELTRRIETAVAANDAESAERLQTALAENARLRQQLEDATTMLDAITNIERSISESEVQ